MKNMNNIIQSLWIGPKLSVMEQLCIKSFLANGHEFHLYCYNEIENVPEGTTICDGNEILPESEVFSYQVGPGKGSYSAFSNYFRYKMLEMKGGWWVDTDIICLKPFDHKGEFVFSSEITHENTQHTTSSVIKAPAGNDFSYYCYNICADQDKKTLEWGTVGPKLVKGAVEFFEMEAYVQEPHVFCPMGYQHAPLIVQEGIDIDFPEETYAVHLWNEMWRRHGIDKEKKYDDSTIYEQLKSRYGVTNDN
jgi:hypothetical protein